MQFMLNVYFVIRCIFRYTHAGPILCVQDRSCTYKAVPGLPFFAVRVRVRVRARVRANVRVRVSGSIL